MLAVHRAEGRPRSPSPSPELDLLSSESYPWLNGGASGEDLDRQGVPALPWAPALWPQQGVSAGGVLGLIRGSGGAWAGKGLFCWPCCTCSVPYATTHAATVARLQAHCYDLHSVCATAW